MTIPCHDDVSDMVCESASKPVDSGPQASLSIHCGRAMMERRQGCRHLSADKPVDSLHGHGMALLTLTWYVGAQASLSNADMDVVRGSAESLSTPGRMRVCRFHV